LHSIKRFSHFLSSLINVNQTFYQNSHKSNSQPNPNDTKLHKVRGTDWERKGRRKKIFRDLEINNTLHTLIQHCNFCHCQIILSLSAPVTVVSTTTVPTFRSAAPSPWVLPSSLHHHDLPLSHDNMLSAMVFSLCFASVCFLLMLYLILFIY
jgi:hypothetical protein